MGNEEAAKTIGDFFVPLAVSRAEFEAIGKELGWEVEAGVTFAFHVVDHEGKLIAKAMPDEIEGLDWSKPLAYGKDMVRFLSDVLEKTGHPMKRARVDPSDIDIGGGLRTDGSARLSVCVRQKDKHAVSGGNNWCKWPMIDTAVLSDEQLRSLNPEKVEAGTNYDIPVDTAAQFAAVLSLDSTRACKLYADDVTETKLAAEVASVSDDAIEVRLRGRIAGSGGAIEVSGSGELEGRLRFNRDGQLQELVVLYEGEYQGGMIDRMINSGKGTPLEAIVQWRREKP